MLSRSSSDVKEVVLSSVFNEKVLSFDFILDFLNQISFSFSEGDIPYQLLCALKANTVKSKKVSSEFSAQNGLKGILCSFDSKYFMTLYFDRADHIHSVRFTASDSTAIASQTMILLASEGCAVKNTQYMGGTENSKEYCNGRVVKSTAYAKEYHISECVSDHYQLLKDEKQIAIGNKRIVFHPRIVKKQEVIFPEPSANFSEMAVAVINARHFSWKAIPLYLCPVQTHKIASQQVITDSVYTATFSPKQHFRTLQLHQRFLKRKKEILRKQPFSGRTPELIPPASTASSDFTLSGQLLFRPSKKKIIFS